MESLCPVCLREGTTLLYEVSSREAAQHFVRKEVDRHRYHELERHICRIWGQDHAAVVQCAQCYFCYAQPFKAGDATFYRLAYQRTGFPRWKWEYDVTFQVLLEIYGKDSSAALLEIGAGNGAFLKRVSPSMISSTNVVCTEYDDYGATAIRSMGIQCISKDIREIQSSQFERKFDIICLFQVLEHMDGLDHLFEHLHCLASSKGNLFIAVPNHHRIFFNEKNGAVLDMPPNHIGRWNRTCFEKIGERTGWKVTDHKTESESALSALKYFGVDRYLRKTQYTGHFYNTVETIKKKAIRRLIQLPLVALEGIRSLPLLPRLSSAEMGYSQWVWMTKL